MCSDDNNAKMALQDEVIADSEDDESYYPLVTSNAGKAFSDLVDVSSIRRVGELSIESPIQAATFKSRPGMITIDGPSTISSFTPSAHIEIPRKSIAPSTISSFPSIPNVSNTTTTSKPRPKPRPAYRGAQATSTLLNKPGSAAGPSEVENASVFNPLDSLQLEDRFGPSLADRTKMRSRNSIATKFIRTPTKNSGLTPKSNLKTKSKKPKPGPVPDSEVINITSSEDELAPDPLPKNFPKSDSKPKPKPAKHMKTSSDHPVPKDPQPFLPLSDSQTTITTIPILSSSILPPSEPPPPSTIHTSTPSPIINHSYGMDGGNAEMSPPSSFDVGKRRKRPPGPIVPEFDFAMELDLDLHLGGGSDSRRADEAEDSKRMPPPPTPFFVGSSSSNVNSELDVLNVTSNASTTVEKVKKKRETKKKTKSKKGEKVSVVNRSPAGGMAVDGEGDFPCGEILDPRSKRKKAKASKAAVEVVNQSKGDGSAKGVFKSREYIDDDDEPLGIPVLASVVNPYVQEHEASSRFDSGLEDEADKNMSRKGEDKEKERDRDKTQNRKRKSMADDNGEDPEEMNEPRPAKKSAGKKARKVISEDELEGAKLILHSCPPEVLGTGMRKEVAKNQEDDLDEPMAEEIQEQAVKENILPAKDPSYLNKPPPTSPIASSSKVPSHAYSISRTKSTPMSELIRRVNSHPGSPFRTPSSNSSLAYSPLLKSSRSLLSRIAPLHPTRRPPPPPPPPIPKTKERKSKKMLEMEERWEEELSESVDGWVCLQEAEREALRRRKKELALGGYED